MGSLTGWIALPRRRRAAYPESPGGLTRRLWRRACCITGPQGPGLSRRAGELPQRTQLWHCRLREMAAAASQGGALPLTLPAPPALPLPLPLPLPLTLPLLLSPCCRYCRRHCLQDHFRRERSPPPLPPGPRRWPRGPRGSRLAPRREAATQPSARSERQCPGRCGLRVMTLHPPQEAKCGLCLSDRTLASAPPRLRHTHAPLFFPRPDPRTSMRPPSRRTVCGTFALQFEAQARILAKVACGRR